MRRLRRGRRGLCLSAARFSGYAGRRVLLISPSNSYRLVPYVEAARRLGIEPLIASQGRHSPIAEVAGGIHVDLADGRTAEKVLLDSARRRPVHGVVGTDDATVGLAARVAAQLGLPRNPPQAAVLTRRKDLARACLEGAGVPVPEHRRVDLRSPLAPQLQGLSCPCVVKPLALSGSRGVIRADSPEALLGACRRVARIVEGEPSLSPEERRYVLVERFVGGPEYAVEGMLHEGRLQVLALFDKPDPLDGPFFEETYYVTPSRLGAELQERIRRRVAEACEAYGLREGPIHAELRLNGGEIWIMEVAARTIGGQCARLLRFGTGHGLEDLVLARAVGRSLALQRPSGAAGVLMIPIPRAGILRRVEGVLAAQRVRHVEALEISVREGYELVPLPEGASYLGFIFARAPTPGQAEEALRRAHAHLRVVTVPILDVEITGNE